MQRIILYILLSLAFTVESAFAEGPILWQGNFGKILPVSGLSQFSGVTIRDCGATNPSAGGGIADPMGSFCQSTTGGVGDIYIKTGAGATAWTSVLTALTGWSLLGNAGTNPANNFIGTTDAQDFVIRTNNTEKARVTSGGILKTTVVGSVGTGGTDSIQINNTHGTSMDEFGIDFTNTGFAGSTKINSLLNAGGASSRLEFYTGGTPPTLRTILDENGDFYPSVTGTYSIGTTAMHWLRGNFDNLRVANSTAHGLLVGQGNADVTYTAAGATNTVLHGNTGADPTYSAVSLTADVTGILPLANGGTNKNNAASNGSLVYSDATGFLPGPIGVAGQAAVSGGAGPYTWFNPTQGSVLFSGASGILAQDNTKLFWDDTLFRLLVGTNPTISGPNTPGQIHVENTGGTDHNINMINRGTNNAVEIQTQNANVMEAALVNNVGAGGAAITLERARGTINAKTQMLAGDVYGGLFFQGYTGTTFTGFGAAIAAVATENITATNSGGQLIFTTSPNGTNLANTVRLTIDQNGNLNVPILTASLPVQTDASKNLISSAINLASGQVSGILPLANGGTNKNNTASNGAVAYSDASGITLSAVGAAGQVLQSNGAAAPTWSTPTYPSASGAAGKILRSDGVNNVYTTATFPNTAAQYDLLYASAANTWSSLATANTAALVTSNVGAESWASGTTANRVLRTDGTTVSFSQVALATDVTGTLPAANLPGPSTGAFVTNIDWSVAKNIDYLYTLTLSANTTLTWNNITAGQTIVIAITNTASNWTVTWPVTAHWPGGTAPTETIGAKTDVITCKAYSSTDAYCNSVQSF